MEFTIEIKNKLMYRELLKELVDIKQDVVQLSKEIIILLGSLTLDFLRSYHEYSLSNIRKYGLTEILIARAFRFFNMEREEEEEYSISTKNKNTISLYQNTETTALKQKTKPYETRRVLLFPFYLLILMIYKSREVGNKSPERILPYRKNVYRE